MTGLPLRLGYKTYWVTWALLLVLSLVMLLADGAPAARWALVSFLVVAMLVKASLIGSNFMHLRFEKLSLIVAVAAGILATAAALFFVIAVDGLRILQLSGR